MHARKHTHACYLNASWLDGEAPSFLAAEKRTQRICTPCSRFSPTTTLTNKQASKTRATGIAARFFLLLPASADHFFAKRREEEEETTPIRELSANLALLFRKVSLALRFDPRWSLPSLGTGRLGARTRGSRHRPWHARALPRRVQTRQMSSFINESFPQRFSAAPIVLQ